MPSNSPSKSEYPSGPDLSVNDCCREMLPKDATVIHAAEAKSKV
jgi:hypothetical protein